MNNGNPQALVYDGSSAWGDGGAYYIAFEDLVYDVDPSKCDRDYQDMVVKAENIEPPIPEPGTLLLLGSGLVGLVGYGKLRLSRKKKK